MLVINFFNLLLPRWHSGKHLYDEEGRVRAQRPSSNFPEGISAKPGPADNGYINKSE